jgi:hypothetical protein
MTLEELLALIAAEPPRSEVREVSVPNAELLADAAKGMLVSDFVADPRGTRESRTFRTGHILGPPATPHEIETWQQSLHCTLPDDLRELLLRANGIHLWADLETGRAYEGLAPLQEWRLVDDGLQRIAPSQTFTGKRYVLITYHTDGSSYVALDPNSSRYYLMDACGADESCPLGNHVSALLDWLWGNRVP